MSNQNLTRELFNKLRQEKERFVETVPTGFGEKFFQNFINDLYSEQTHFIYELLQNADDARATTARFILKEDGLIFAHDGKTRFSVSDIGAITSFGKSNEKSWNQIGKFGVGFKAVFQYTHTPEIYDIEFKFKIERLFIPVWLDQDHPERDENETLFYFPFNDNAKLLVDTFFQGVLDRLSEKSKEKAFEEISGKLKNLKNPLFFLRHLKEIRWKIHNQQGSYKKDVKPSQTYNNQIEVQEVRLIEPSIVHNFLVFTKKVDNNHSVSAAFSIGEDKKVLPNTEHAYCFFPTKEETELHFIVQAPFLLNNSREGIKRGERWNDKLIEAIANLAADSLPIFRDMGLLNDAFFKVLPLESEDHLFKPVAEAVKSKLRSSEPLLPTATGFTTKENAYLADNLKLHKLLTDEQLAALVKNSKAQWVFRTLTDNSPIWRYVKENLIKNTISPESFVGNITIEFMTQQTTNDEWLIKFYSYLLDMRSLWTIVKEMPIIKLSNGKFVEPFYSGKPQVYLPLPSGVDSEFDTVKPCFAKNKECLQFFKELGLSHPDEYDEIKRKVFSRYKQKDSISQETLLNDFRKILNYSLNCPSGKGGEYIREAKEIPFCIYKKDDKYHLSTADKLYFETDELKKYFAHCKDVYFLDAHFYQAVHKEFGQEKVNGFLRELGVADRPRRTPNKLHGLTEAINHVSFDVSKIIWNYLLESMFYGNSFFEETVTSFRDKRRSKPIQVDTNFLWKLKCDKWLYDVNGQLVSPSDISIKQLSDSYDKEHFDAKKLIDKLCFKQEESLAVKRLKKLEQLATKKGMTVEQYLDYREKQDNPVSSGEARQRTSTTPSANKIAQSIEFQEDDDETNDSQGVSQSTRPQTPRTQKPRGQARNFHDESKDLDERSNVDEDEYNPTEDETEALKRKRDRLKRLYEQQNDDFFKIEELKTSISQTTKYTFAWFKFLLELEQLQSYESRSNGREISIQFASVEREPGTQKILLLKYPSRYIPHKIEDFADISLQLFFKNEADNRTVTIEVVSVKDDSLRAKLKFFNQIEDLDSNQVVKAVIDIKNPTFILESLKTEFAKLDLQDDDNLQENLPEDLRFIFGPPGTGKTTHLATHELIPLMQGAEDEKILVLTPTNKAADVLVKKIMENSDNYSEWLVRFGLTGDYEIEQEGLLKDRFFDIHSLSRCVVVTTIARFPYDGFNTNGETKQLRDYDWDMIIFDESSMIMLAAMVYVLYKKPECQFIVAGDPHQIQPIVIVNEWKEENIYSLVDLRDPKWKVKRLGTQYRSIPPIGELFSHFTYEGKLKHQRTEIEQKQLNLTDLELKPITVITFPVSPFESLYKAQRLNGSAYHIYSAILAVELAIYIMSELIKDNTQENWKDWKVGIICPYKAQATIVDKMVAALFEKTPQIEILVGTIHGFQGDECDIILDLLNSPPSISSGIFLNKHNILNVSISRAKDYLILLVPEDTNGLDKIQRLHSILEQDTLQSSVKKYCSEEVEEAIFQQSHYIRENAFVTTHQDVNVYTKPDKKYEIRCEDNAVDVQLFLGTK